MIQVHTSESKSRGNFFTFSDHVNACERLRSMWGDKVVGFLILQNLERTEFCVCFSKSSVSESCEWDMVWNGKFAFSHFFFSNSSSQPTWTHHPAIAWYSGNIQVLRYFFSGHEGENREGKMQFQSCLKTMTKTETMKNFCYFLLLHQQFFFLLLLRNRVSFNDNEVGEEQQNGTSTILNLGDWKT